MKAEDGLPFVGYWVRKLPKSSSRITVAESRALFARVPMPKTKDPVTLGAPSAGIAGNSIMAPLLSWLKNKTGFDNCLATGTATAWQPPAVVDEQA